MKNTNKTAVPSVNDTAAKSAVPAVIANSTAYKELSAVGLTTDISPDDYRRKLRDSGVVGPVSDYTAMLAGYAADAMETAGVAGRRAALSLGILARAEQWKNEKDANGKPFKSESAFLHALFPRFAYSTVLLYKDVGQRVYLPVKSGNPDFKGLDWLESMTPGNAKFIVSALKDADTRPFMIEELRKLPNKAESSQKSVTEAVKAAKEAAGKSRPRTKGDGTADGTADGTEDANKPDTPLSTTTDNVTAEDVETSLVLTMEAFFTGTVEADEISLLITESARETLFSTLDDCAINATSATAFCKAFRTYLTSLK